MDSKTENPNSIVGEEDKEIGVSDCSNENAKVIQWEDYEQELARFCSLTSALEEANQKKLQLKQKLEPLIQLQGESSSRSNKLDDMHKRLESRKLVMGNMAMHSKVMEEKVKRGQEQLTAEVGSLTVSGSCLSAATKRLQDANRSLAGERGYLHLNSIQKLLALRQQYMVSQVSMLYPVKVAAGPSQEQELESFTSSIKSGVLAGSNPLDQGSLTIVGLHLTMTPFTKKNFFNDKKEVQQSATAMGYVAHAVSLIASYLQVPLRYPLRFGCSRSYIRDYAPSTEPTASDSASDSLDSTTGKLIEFPLFWEGQDSTRAAYGVFLLNKDLEQLLNYVGVDSVGPRHVLANLKELLKTILSPEYIDRDR